MPQLFILFENAAGYALFRTSEFEEIAGFLPQVRKTILDVSKFRSIVHLMSYQKFEKNIEAVENMRDIVEGVLPKQLQVFLENNVPKSQISKQSVELGVQDLDLASVITETLGITCTTSAIVTEITRGIRTHFFKLVKGFKDSTSAIRAQLALAHHYSRSRVNFTQTRTDSMISGALNMTDQVQKNFNKQTLRLKKCYSIHFPELSRIVPDPIIYTKCVDVLGDRYCLPDDVESKLMVILNDSNTVQNILYTAKKSMGMEITDTDLQNIKYCTQYIFNLINQLQDYEDYLKLKMQQSAPNLSKITGELVGAQLISRAGGLMNLAKLPSTTVQVLGAPKALFRSKRTFDSTKFGILSGCNAVIKSKGKRKLNISRLLANKCALASRTDCFAVKGREKKDFSNIWLKDINDRIKFFDRTKKNTSIEIPKVNAENKTFVESEISPVLKELDSSLQNNGHSESDAEHHEKSVVQDQEASEVECYEVSDTEHHESDVVDGKIDKPAKRKLSIEINETSNLQDTPTSKAKNSKAKKKGKMKKN